MPLAFDQVTFAYPARKPGERPVLRGLSFALEPASVACLVGLNASGKSTILRLATGFLRPDHGRVTLDDAPVHTLAPRDRSARLAYVPQRATLAFPFTVRESVAFGRHGRAPAPHAVQAALERVDLADRADDPFHVLSVGQQQRATLARALAQVWADHHAPSSPPVILADEPCSAMDPAHALGAFETFAELAREGAAVLLVVHDLSAAARVADRVLVLDQSGSLAADDAPARAMTDPVLESVFRARFDRVAAPDGRLVSLTPVARLEPIDSLGTPRDHA